MALRHVRFAQDRLPNLQWMLTPSAMPDRPWDLWKLLLHLVHEAIAQRDWPSVGEFLKLYDFVHLRGKSSEMIEMNYVAFLEDLRLPDDPADLRKFWQVCPPIFLRDIERERRVSREP